MLADISVVKNIYVATGVTDMRKSINGLVAIIQEQFQLSPFTPSLFLFCGRRRDRFKAILWQSDGFVLIYKRLENGGRYKWPNDLEQPMTISWKEFTWLMDGLEINQPKALKPIETPGLLY